MSLLTSKWLIFPGILVAILVLLYILGKKSVHHEITIQATPDQVWAVLSNTQNYPDWNPVMIKVQGELTEGNTVTYSFQQDKDNQYDIPATVKKIEPAKLLNQGGGISGVLTYDHHYILEPVAGGTKVIIHEDYRGIGVPFWNPAPVEAAYKRLNQALKARVLEVYPYE